MTPELEFKTKMWKLSEECLALYYSQQKVWGSEFDSRMAEVCVEITILAEKDRVTFAEATLGLLSLEQDTDDIEEMLSIEETNRDIKAAFVWQCFEKSDLEKALRELG